MKITVDNNNCGIDNNIDSNNNNSKIMEFYEQVKKIIQSYE